MSGRQPVHINGLEFYCAVTNVLPFAATDDSRPVLTGVHLVVADDSVWAVCADAFAFAFARMAVSGHSATAEPWSVTIPRDRIDVLVRVLATEKKQLAHEAVVLSEAGIECAQLSTLVRYEPIDGHYPDFRRVIQEGEGTPVTSVALGQWLMKRLQAVNGGKETIRFVLHGDLQAVECRIGESFRAFLMPVRTSAGPVVTPPPVVTPVLADSAA